MLPEKLPTHVESGAERTVFARIRDELSNEWIALHSLGMTIHDRKPWAEIDFVLIGPPGVFCLEVKGGLVEREGGVWYTTPRFGKRAGWRDQLTESPFSQVGSASAQLFKYLVGRIPRMTDVITGYAIVTPDCRWTATGPDLDRALVYDDNDAFKPFDVFMDRVATRWDEKVGRGWNRDLALLQRREKEVVRELLRGDFSLVPSLQASLENASDSLVSLTSEQAEIFSRLATNPRVIARGGAGTGKTLLAVAEARRLAAMDKRVLLTCFSRNLARHLDRVLADCPNVTVRTLDSLIVQIVKDAGRANDFPDAQETDLFEVLYPDAAIEILLATGGGRFDALVVDEGQDLLSDSHLDVLELCLEDGLDAGTWRWFLDPNQNIFGGMAVSGMKRLLKNGPVDWRLTINCRNTIPIATQVSFLSGAPLTESLVIDGPEVEYSWYTTPEGQRHDVARNLRRVIHEGIIPNRIALLSRRQLSNSGIANGLPGALPPLADVSRGGIDSLPPNAIMFSTVASFKGLEADAVFLLDVDDLESPEALATVYVGTSRARSLLVVFMHEGVRPDLAEQGRRFGAALATAEAETFA